MCNKCNPVENATRYRHRMEMPMVALAIVLSIAAVVVSLTTIGTEQNDAEDWRYFGLIVLIAPLIIFVQRFFTAAMGRANGAKVGPQQFPEVWQIYAELLTAFDLKHAPSLYVVNGNGTVNAFALSCTVRQKYVVLHAEIAALVQVDPQIVRFVLAHELAHHKLGHSSLVRLAIGAVMNALYLPGKAYIRAQEYSADRLAMAVCPDAAESLIFLTVGPWLAQEINPDAFVVQIEEEDHSPMVRIANIISDHAVMTKRYKALLEIRQHGFDRHGQMF